MLAYIRTQEEQADRAGVKFLTATGQSPKGMYDTFKRLGDEILYQSRYIDPYLQTHPMPQGARRRARGAGQGQPVLGQEGSARAAAAPRYDARQAVRLHGSRPTSPPPLSGERPAACRRAMPAPSRLTGFSDPRAAMAQIDGLIQAQPQQSVFL